MVVNKTPPPVPIRSPTTITSSPSSIKVFVKPIQKRLVPPPPPPPPPAREIKALLNSQGRAAFRCVCPACKNKIKTRAEEAANTGRVKEIIIWIALLGCIVGVVLLPLGFFLVGMSILMGFILLYIFLELYVKCCSFGLPDVMHYCPECGVQLGINFGGTVSLFGTGSSGFVTLPRQQYSATSIKSVERNYSTGMLHPLKRAASDSTIIDIETRSKNFYEGKIESEV